MKVNNSVCLFFIITKNRNTFIYLNTVWQKDSLELKRFNAL